jgi:hypothetical protein
MAHCLDPLLNSNSFSYAGKLCNEAYGGKSE